MSDFDILINEFDTQSEGDSSEEGSDADTDVTEIANVAASVNSGYNFEPLAEPNTDGSGTPPHPPTQAGDGSRYIFSKNAC